MEQAIVKFIEFVFTQGSGYITLVVCFGLFYFDFKKWQTEMFNKMNDKLDDMEKIILECHAGRDK